MLTQDALNGKTAVVAGGTSGINREIAATFARHGAKVAVFSRDQAKVDETVGYLESISGSGGAIGAVADVRDFDAVDGALRIIHGKYGAFDIVVSGAAGLFVAPAEKMSSNAFRTVIEIDLLGTFHVYRAAYDFLRKPGASLIGISAPQATAPYWGQSHACAAKAGVEMLTKALAYEWACHGIRVNAVVPGPMAGTEGVTKLSKIQAVDQVMRKSVPLGRYGDCEDVANMCTYLACDIANFITGEIIRVDGGQILTGGMWIEPTSIAQG